MNKVENQEISLSKIIEAQIKSAWQEGYRTGRVFQQIGWNLNSTAAKAQAEKQVKKLIDLTHKLIKTYIN